MAKPKYAFIDHRVAGWYFPWMMGGRIPTSSPLAAKLRLVKELGYDGLGTSWWDLVSAYQEHGDLGQIRELSSSLQLPITGYTFIADGWAFAQGEAHKKAMMVAISSLDLAHQAGCKTPCLVGPFDSGDLRTAAKAFRELAQYAEQFGLQLGLEFMGASAEVNGIKPALELVGLAGVDSSGIAIDTYHFFAGSSTFADLEALPISKIRAVHLADGPSDLSDPSVDFNRIMPGEGQLRLTDFISILGAKGFDGYWHLECISGVDYAADLRDVAKRGLGLMKGTVEKGLASKFKGAHP